MSQNGVYCRAFGKDLIKEAAHIALVQAKSVTDVTD